MTPVKKEPDLSTFPGRVAARLRELRGKAKLSQGELAEKINVKQTAISNWENAANMPPIERLPDIARALNTSIRNLLPKE